MVYVVTCQTSDNIVFPTVHTSQKNAVEDMYAQMKNRKELCEIFQERKVKSEDIFANGAIIKYSDGKSDRWGIWHVAVNP